MERVNTALLNHVPHEPDEATMRGRPKAALVLTDAEHAQPTALTLWRKTAQALACAPSAVSRACDQRCVVAKRNAMPRNTMPARRLSHHWARAERCSMVPNSPLKQAMEPNTSKVAAMKTAP